MKNITIYILLLCSGLSSIAQNAPTWTSTDACIDNYVGSITIEFYHDSVEFPLPYEASYYNTTTGDYEEIIITSSPFTIGDLSPGEYELEVLISDVDIMEFCAEVYSYDMSTDITFDKRDANCGYDNGRLFIFADNIILSNSNETVVEIYDNLYNLIGETEISTGIAWVKDLPAGTHSVHIQMDNGCEHWYTIDIGVIPKKIPFDLVSIEKACVNDGSIDIYVDPAGGLYNYKWTKKDSDEKYYKQDLSNISSGTYCIHISEKTLLPSCVYTDTCIVVPTTLDFEVHIDHLCDDAEKTGQIAINTIHNYSYEWDTDPIQNVPVISNLSSGKYCVTISSEVEDCVHSECFDVDVLEPLEIQNLTYSSSCPTKNDGTISFEIYPQTYDTEVVWGDLPASETSVTSRENLAAGDYSVTISNGCETISETITIGYSCYCSEWKDFVNLSELKNDCISTTEPDGAIVLSSLYNETYKWSTGATGNQILGLAVGEYTVTITDTESSCKKSFSFNIAFEEGVAVELVELNPHCSEQGGSIEVEIIGDSYELFWWGSVNYTNYYENLSAGTYTLQVTDVCSTRWIKYVIPESEAYIDDYSQSGCSPTADITVEIEGTNPPFEIEWETGEIGTLHNVQNGKTYKYTITDNLGCQFEGDYNKPHVIEEINRIEPCEGVQNGSISFEIKNPDEEDVYILYDFGPCGECQDFPFITPTSDTLLSIDLTGLEAEVEYSFTIFIGGCPYTYVFSLSEQNWDKDYQYSEYINGVHYCIYDRVCQDIVIEEGITIPATLEPDEFNQGSSNTFQGFGHCGRTNLVCEEEQVSYFIHKPLKMRSLEAKLFYFELGINLDQWLFDLMDNDPCSYWWVCPNGTVQPSRASGDLLFWGGTWSGSGLLDENGCKEIKCTVDWGLWSFSDNYTVCPDSLNWLPVWIEPYVNQSGDDNDIKCEDISTYNVFALINTYELFQDLFDEVFEDTEMLDFIIEYFDDEARFCSKVQICSDDFSVMWSDIDDIECEISEEDLSNLPLDFNGDLLEPCQVVGTDYSDETTTILCPTYCNDEEDHICYLFNIIDSYIEIPGFTQTDTTSKEKSKRIVLQPQFFDTEFAYFADYVTEQGNKIYTPISKSMEGSKMVSSFYNNSYQLLPIENIFYMYEDFRDGYNFTINENENSYLINSGIFLAKQQMELNSEYLKLESSYFDGEKAFLSGSYLGELKLGTNILATSNSISSFTCTVDKEYNVLDYAEYSITNHLSSNGHLFTYNYLGSEQETNFTISNDIIIYNYHFDRIYGDEYIVFGGSGKIVSNGNVNNITNSKGVKVVKMNAGHIEWIKQIGIVDQINTKIALDSDKEKNLYVGYSFKDRLTLEGISLNAENNFDNLILKIDESGNLGSYYHIDNESDEFIIDLKNIENYIAIGLTVKDRVFERKLGDYTFVQYDGNQSKSINSLIDIKNMTPFTGLRNNKTASRIQIFDVIPNPASNSIKIVTGLTTEKCEIDITAISGQKVLSVNDTKNSIDVSSLKSGIYIIKLTTENGTFSKKLIITK